MATSTAISILKKIQHYSPVSINSTPDGADVTFIVVSKGRALKKKHLVYTEIVF